MCVLTNCIVKLEKLDKYHQQAMITTNTKTTTHTVWVGQHYDLKTFFLSDHVLWFPKGHKEHKSKFKK